MSGFIPGYGPLERLPYMSGAFKGDVGPYTFMGNQAPTYTPAQRGPTPRNPGVVPRTSPYYGGLGHPTEPKLGVVIPGRPPKPPKKKGGGPGGPGAAPVDPWQQIINQILGNYESPAEQEARVKREVDAQVAAQQKMIDAEYAQQRADALAQAQAQSQWGLAAAAMNKDLFAQVGGEYNAAAGEISGLAHGLSGAAAGATGADIASQNAGLAAVGMPGITEGGQFGTAGPGQAGVEEFRGGTLEAGNFGIQGQAANFGLAGMIGAQSLRATQEAQMALGTSMHDIRANQAKAIDSLASGRLDLYHQYMSDAKDAQIKSISLAQGLLSAQQASGGGKTPTTRKFGDNWYQYTGPGTGEKGSGWTKVYQGAPKKGKPTKLQLKEFADGIWSWNPVTGEKVKFQGKPPAGTPPNLTYKDVLMPDGTYHTVGIDPKTGKRVPGVDLGPSKTQPTPPKGKTGTKKTLTQGQLDTMVKGWYTGATSKQNVGTAANPNWQEVPTGQGQIKYQQAYNNLRARGYNDVEARTALDIYWKRGERGRPWLAGPARQTLTKKGLRPTPRFYLTDIAGKDIKDKNGKVIVKKGEWTRKIPYLLRAQYEALRAAGQAPPGAWAEEPGIGRVFVIHSE
jgi:hypothetical protein